MQRVTGLLALAALVVPLISSGCTDDGGDQTTRPAPEDPDGPPDRSGGSVVTGPGGGGVDDDPSDTGLDGTSGDAGDAGTPSVQATFAFEDILGEQLSGASVVYRGESTTLDDQNEGAVSLRRRSSFDVRFKRDQFFDHRIMGRAGGMDFRYVVPVLSRSSAREAFNATPVTLDEQQGILAVNIRTPELDPLVGAQAILDSPHDQPITIGTNGTSEPDNMINSNEQAIVAFPNVDTVDDINLTIEPPNNETCRRYPDEDADDSIRVEAGTVTVVTYVCSGV